MSDEPNKHKAMAKRTTILLADCGSRGFGLNFETSDHDLKGVCIEDLDAHLTLGSRFEQFIEKVGPNDPASNYVDNPSYPSGYPGHDLVIYSLEKFVRLAIAGNPDVTPLLFSKECVGITEEGLQLQDLVPSMIHKGWAKRFLGYMESQRQKLIGERGQKRVNRDDLIAAHGFDSKYAYHLLRLGMQGIELMTDGRITMPFTGSNQTYLLDVRAGKVSLNECLQRAGDLERDLKDLATDSQWPDEPNREYVDHWIREKYWLSWKARESSYLFGVPSIIH